MMPGPIVCFRPVNLAVLEEGGVSPHVAELADRACGHGAGGAVCEGGTSSYHAARLVTLVGTRLAEGCLPAWART